MDVESFQTLTMAEKLQLWKLKSAGKLNSQPGQGVVPQQLAQSQTQKECRSPNNISNEIPRRNTLSSSMLTKKELGNEDRRKSFITTTRGRENQSSKRKSIWGTLPASPLVDSLQGKQLSPVLTKVSDVIKSPILRIQLVDDQNTDPNTVNIENAMRIDKSIDSLHHDIFGFDMSPTNKTFTRKTSSSIFVMSAKTTPAQLQNRDSTGYYTANESIDHSMCGFESSSEIRKVCNSRRSSTESFIMNQRDSLDKPSSAKSLKIIALENSLATALQELERLKYDFTSLSKEKMIQAVKIHSLEEQKKELETKVDYFSQDAQAAHFLNSVLEQKNNELSVFISTDRLNKNEQLASKTKKYKSQIEKLNNEKMMYEERANAMCLQMGEQMSLLQSTAMGRIEVRVNCLLLIIYLSCKFLILI